MSKAIVYSFEELTTLMGREIVPSWLSDIRNRSRHFLFNDLSSVPLWRRLTKPAYYAAHKTDANNNVFISDGEDRGFKEAEYRKGGRYYYEIAHSIRGSEGYVAKIEIGRIVPKKDGFGEYAGTEPAIVFSFNYKPENSSTTSPSIEACTYLNNRIGNGLNISEPLTKQDMKTALMIARKAIEAIDQGKKIDFQKMRDELIATAGMESLGNMNENLLKCPDAPVGVSSVSWGAFQNMTIGMARGRKQGFLSKLGIRKLFGPQPSSFIHS